MPTSTRPWSRRFTVVVAVAALLSAAPPARAAEEVYPFPSTATSVTFAGHGYGHGRGMSQWGAQGAALSGLTWQQIVAFYYPHTTLTSTFGNPAIRVRVSKVPATAVGVRATATLALTAGGATRVLPTTSATGAAITAYRLVPTTTAAKLQYLSGTVWQDEASAPAVASPAVLADPAAAAVVLTLASGATQRYRGSVTVLRLSATELRTVNVLPLDDYLRGVVPAEAFPSWHQQALGAQAVAARSYAAYRMSAPLSSTYDICDDTACQSYSGTAFEAPSTDAAVVATSGSVITYSGTPVIAEFGAANGGWTVASSLPWQVAQADPYDGLAGGSSHAWTTSVAVSTITARYPSIGTFRQLRILSRDGHGEWGGRVLSMAIDGTSGSVTVSGSSFAGAVGLRHYWFIPTNAGGISSRSAFPRDLSADGRADVLTISAATGALVLRPGNGAGGFLPARQVGTGWGGLRAALWAGPFDSDGYADLMGIRTDGTLWLFRGDGRGGVSAGIQVGTGWGTMRYVRGVGDWNGDGSNDVLAVHPDGLLALYPGNGSGGWGGSSLIGNGWAGFTALVAGGDLTSDGYPDLLARTSDGRLLLYPGNGRGGFLTPRQVGSGWVSTTSMTISGDLTGDGRADLLARRRDGSWWIYPGTGTGTWRAALAFSPIAGSVDIVLP